MTARRKLGAQLNEDRLRDLCEKVLCVGGPLDGKLLPSTLPPPPALECVDMRSFGDVLLDWDHETPCRGVVVPKVHYRGHVLAITYQRGDGSVIRARVYVYVCMEPPPGDRVSEIALDAVERYLNMDLITPSIERN